MNLATTATASTSALGSAEWTESLRRAEDSFRKISAICRLQKTAHPYVFCSTLPRHWRSNKSLPTPFVVVALQPISDGTKVSVAAGNEENHTADVKNNVAEFGAQMARFTDLRFVGKSGRGKNFNLTITIHSRPVTQVATVINVIKVTVDGPRDSRNANKSHNGQQNARKRENASPVMSATKKKFGVDIFEGRQIVDSSISPPSVKRQKFSVLSTITLGNKTQNDENNTRHRNFNVNLSQTPKLTTNLTDTTIDTNAKNYKLGEQKNNSSKRRRATTMRERIAPVDYARKSGAQNTHNDNQAAALTLYNSMLAAAAFGASIRQNSAALPQLLIPDKDFASTQLNFPSRSFFSPPMKAASTFENLAQKHQTEFLPRNTFLNQSLSRESVTAFLTQRRQNSQTYSPPISDFVLPQTSAFNPLTQILAAASVVRAATAAQTATATPVPLSQISRLPNPAALNILPNDVQTSTALPFAFNSNCVRENHPPLMPNSNANSLLLYQQLMLNQLRNQQQQQERRKQQKQRSEQEEPVVAYQQNLEKQQQQTNCLPTASSILLSNMRSFLTKTTPINENALHIKSDNLQKTKADSTNFKKEFATSPLSKSSDEQISKASLSSTDLSSPSTSFYEIQIGDCEADSGKIELRQNIPASSNSSLREFAQSSAATQLAFAVLSAEESAADIEKNETGCVSSFNEYRRDSCFVSEKEKQKEMEEYTKPRTQETLSNKKKLLRKCDVRRSKSCAPECSVLKQQSSSHSAVSTPNCEALENGTTNLLKFNFERTDNKQMMDSSINLFENYSIKMKEEKEKKNETIENNSSQKSSDTKKRRKSGNHLWRPFETAEIINFNSNNSKL